MYATLMHLKHNYKDMQIQTNRTVVIIINYENARDFFSQNISTFPVYHKEIVSGFSNFILRNTQSTFGILE